MRGRMRMLARPSVVQAAGAARFFDYWNSLPKEDFVPDRVSFSPVSIARLMPAVTLIEVRSDDMLLQRLTGTAVCRHMGFDPTGQNMLDLLVPETRIPYLELLHTQLSHPCGRWSIVMNRRDNVMDRVEILAMPLRHRQSGNWMLLSYFNAIQSVRYDPGPGQILSYKDTVWIDIGAGLPN